MKTVPLSSSQARPPRSAASGRIQSTYHGWIVGERTSAIPIVQYRARSTLQRRHAAKRAQPISPTAQMALAGSGPSAAARGRKTPALASQCSAYVSRPRKSDDPAST